MAQPSGPAKQKNTRPALDQTVVDRNFRIAMECLAGMRGAVADHAVRNGDIGDIREFIAGLSKGATALQGTVTGIASQVATIEARVLTAESNVITLQSDVLALQGDIATAQSDLIALQAGISTLQGTLADMDTNVGGVSVPGLTSSDATGGDSPTEAEYNLLRADVSNLRTAVLSLQAAILA